MNLTVEWVPNMHMTEREVEGWDALQIPVIRVATLRRVLEHINTEVHGTDAMNLALEEGLTDQQLDGARLAFKYLLARLPEDKYQLPEN